MSDEKVWVKLLTDDRIASTKVRNLKDDAIVDDLLAALVEQQRLQIGSIDLSVSEEEAGQPLQRDAALRPYFVSDKEGKAGPGQSKDTALAVTILPPLLPFPPQQQPQFSEEATIGLSLLGEDYNSKKRSIKMSEVTQGTKKEVMDILSLPEKEASWPNKPTSSQLSGFVWLQDKEDSEENRQAYINYLKSILVIPGDYKLADVQPERSLLSVELFRNMVGVESRKVSGTTDVIIAQSVAVDNEALRNNIETLLELKTPKDMMARDHSPQAIIEHFAASYLNENHAVVSVLTDLDTKWIFFWFAFGEDGSEMSLYKLVLDGEGAVSDAKYLLDSLYGTPCGDTLPSTFANRQPFRAVLGALQRKRARMEPDDGNDPKRRNLRGEGGDESAPMNMANVLSLFAPPGDRDVANELDLLDMVDVDEQYEILKSFAAKHIVPYMYG